MTENRSTTQNDPLVSVIIPLPADPDRAVEALEKINQQTWEHRETILVCGPDTELESLDYPKTRRVDAEQCQNMAELINAGMNGATGDIRALLMPNCLPADDTWLKNLIAPFEHPEVTAVVSQCETHNTRDANLPARLMECVESPEVHDREADEMHEIDLLSHLCDAFRADVITETEELYHAEYPTPGEAVDLSVRIVSPDHKIVLSPAAKVWYYEPPRTRSLSTVFSSAIDYGRADALLGKTHNIDWLGSRIYAAAVLSLLAVPIALIDIPIGVIFTLLLFAWCWFLPLRMPILRWEMPVSVVHIATYTAIVLSIRGHWAPSLFPPHKWHPAIIRQWCFVVALPASFFVVALYDGILSAARSMKELRGVMLSPVILVLSLLWYWLTGVGYIRGYMMDKPRFNDTSDRT